MRVKSWADYTIDYEEIRKKFEILKVGKMLVNFPSDIKVGKKIDGLETLDSRKSFDNICHKPNFLSLGNSRRLSLSLFIAQSTKTTHERASLNNSHSFLFLLFIPFSPKISLSMLCVP